MRAARAIPSAHAGSRLLLWGHSQGGQAVLFAAQDARRYAPELHLVALAAAAPAVELGALLHDDISDDAGVTLGAYAFDAYHRVYGPTTPGTDLATILTPAGVSATPRMAALCLFGQHRELHGIAGPLVGRYLARDPRIAEPWRTLLERNTPGAARIGVPILIAQGDADQLVHPATTTAYVQHLCATGETVRYRHYRDVDHALVAIRAEALARQWFADALAHRRATTTCTGVSSAAARRAST